MRRHTCDKCAYYTPAANPAKPHRGRCALMGDANDGEDVHALDQCIAWDYESYRAGVYVGPKFGCIHWEKRL